MKKIFFLLFSLSLLGLSCTGGTGKADKFIKEEGFVWNTQYHLTYRGLPELGDSVRKILEEVGHNLSVFDSASLVSRVNRHDSTLVNRDFIRVYDMSRKINRISDGVFDPTLSPLITAWGFGPGHKATADTTRIDSLLRIVGIGKTRLHENILIKDDRAIQFNFSAIAKGYGCDRVAEMFKRNEVEDFMVEIGGEIRASGKNPTGTKWAISIDKPVISDSEPVHDSQVIIAFTDMGLATSGNYRNYHNNGAGRYGHTISPITGRPIQTDVLSATVLASTAMEADGLATAFMAMGSDKSKQIAKKLQLPVMLICSDTVWTSPQFEKLIVK